MSLNLLTGEHVGPCIPYRYLNDDDAQTRKSIDKLSEIGRVTMLPGHGRPWVGSMAEAVDLAREAAFRRARRAVLPPIPPR